MTSGKSNGNRKLFATFIVVLTAASVVRAEAPASSLSRETRAAAEKAVTRGLEFLVARQGEEGGWEAFGRPHPAITSLAVKALLHDKRYGPDHPAVKRALAFILTFAKPDGGIYVEGEGMRNYHTAVAIMALCKSEEPAHKEAVRKAQAFLKKLQWDEEEQHTRTSAWYGGQGYGQHKRPDLSNTQLMLEALNQSGLPKDDPAYKKAMVFISRCQMLSETNDQPFARGSDDGGFIYTPANDGESKAGNVIVEGKVQLRTYGSMTYAGFKSMLYADVDRKDPRVQRAFEWIRGHYTLDSNPNMPQGQSRQGLFYYFHVFARAMRAWGEEVIVDREGKAHKWREDLCAKIVALQQPDGSWINEEDRWYEGNPHLVTGYAVRALQTALQE